MEQTFFCLQFHPVTCIRDERSFEAWWDKAWLEWDYPHTYTFIPSPSNCCPDIHMTARLIEFQRCLKEGSLSPSLSSLGVCVSLYKRRNRKKVLDKVYREDKSCCVSKMCVRWATLCIERPLSSIETFSPSILLAFYDTKLQNKKL